MEQAKTWDPHLKELSTNNSVIVFDSRGIGNTTLGNKPFTISQFANDTAGLLDALKINKKVDVLGFSLGKVVQEQRELPAATDIAGVNMCLKPGGIRELHWHKQAE